MVNPWVSHLEARKRILRYVLSTLKYGLFYKKNENFVLSGFVDSDWADDVNDRRSTTAYCFTMGSAAISWCSKKQPNVALSITEVKYYDATMAVQECIWLKMLISHVYGKVDYPISVKCDKESAVKLASNALFYARTKHIEVHHHFIREKVLIQEIELMSIWTNDQVPDVFTKALS
ncbi:hypothetical protein BUALT_Bualt11G0055500 [Buddleja alternifolia]|uniref:Uncharacterized protein n=1 Tax=Buddleja alternifolia TaxID=168488 RepID=A0AAV6WZV8_9LAMI|nr:hypothetical protein BUALT_Bualt11G0055500 [Buddleja alternifolia]